MISKRRYWLAIVVALILAILIVAKMGFRSAPSTDRPKPVAGLSSTDSELSLSHSRPLSAEQRAGTDPTAPLTVSSLREKFVLLTQSPNPRDAFRAYQIVKGCVSIRESEQTFRQTRQADRDRARVSEFEPNQFSPRLAEACGDLTPADLGLSKRVQLVERAAEAGVPMAALFLSSEGPSGDPQALLNRWEDLAVQEWRGKVVGLIHLAAERGDTSSLNSLSEQYETGSGLIAERNPKLALQYAVTQQLVHEAQTGRKVWGGDASLKRLADQLSPSEAKAAREAGRMLAQQIQGGGAK